MTAIVQNDGRHPRRPMPFRILALEESRISSHPGPEERDPGGGSQMLKGADLCLNPKQSSESLVVRPPCPLRAERVDDEDTGDGPILFARNDGRRGAVRSW